MRITSLAKLSKLCKLGLPAFSSYLAAPNIPRMWNMPTLNQGMGE